MTAHMEARIDRTGRSVAPQLEKEGIAVISDLVSGDRLRGMQESFRSRLRTLRWNDVDGYTKTDRYRHMVEDVLTLSQDFVDAALHPVVKATLNDYLGDRYALAEAKGWLSHPTSRDFHGWHGDMWYDQDAVPEIQREVKLAIYLTDVTSGAFWYVKGTHGKMHPRVIGDAEVAEYPDSRIVRATGPAGTGILFDTSGIHRQGIPILEPRQAVFYCYHDPSVPLQQEDIDYYRYHPLLLNAAFLGGLTTEDERILGFGEKVNYQPGFVRASRHEGLQRAMQAALDAKLAFDEFRGLAKARLRRVFGR